MDYVASTPHSSALGASSGAADRLFAGGGESGSLLASIDWSRTKLGPVERWPQTLRTSLRICLTSRHAIIIWWGPDLNFFYNDAYAPTLGIRRDWAMGRPGREVWPEIWPVIGPMLEGVRSSGQATWSDDERLFLERHGYPEETYHTFSYSPIEDETGGVVGVFCAVTETTGRVLEERRGTLARELAAAIVDARSAGDVSTRAAQVLSSDRADVPFALLYQLDRASHSATLLEAVGVRPGTRLSPVHVDLRDDGATWAIDQVAQGRDEIVVERIDWDGVTLDAQIGGQPLPLPAQALILPLLDPGQSVPSAVLVAGVSAWRELDAAYRAFYRVLAGHLSTAFAAARAYETERQRAEELAALDRAKTAFFSNVSHEFRTPLTLMLGPVADSLADTREPLPPGQRERLELIQRNGLRLLKLVNTLLDFARIEAGRVQASYEPTDLAPFTAELASSFRSLVEKAGLQLVVDCPSVGEPVYVDRDMWEKIVLNLLSNAFKFTMDGSLTVRLRRDGDEVELEVRDTGIGVPPEELPRLFERFHRVEGASGRTHEGSGIGLALVQELVHLHGGAIRVESTQGRGTAFFVRAPLGVGHLPAERIQAGRTQASTALGTAAYVEEAERWLPSGDSGAGSAAGFLGMPERTPGGAARPDGATAARPTRIVLADDNADMRDYLRRLLGEYYAVEAVGNGRAALEAIHREVPDLVLSDVMMPELDGFALLRALRADPRTLNLPVILLSARAGEEATIEGLQAGADDYLVKPFSAREVLSRVAARLEIARSRTEVEQHTHQVLEALLAMAEALVDGGKGAGGAPEGEQGEKRENGAQGVFDARRSDQRGLRVALDGPHDNDATMPGEAAHSKVLRVVALAQRVLIGRYIGAAVIDSVTGEMRPLAVVGLTPEIEEKWRQDLSRARVADYLPPEVIQRLYAEEAVILDIAAAPPVPGQDYWGITVAMIVAVRLDAERFLWLGVEALNRRTFTAQERDLAQAAARLAALVVEREQLTREREEARAGELALREATRRMDEFLGIASHELRTPLTSITANVQMAERGLRTLAPRGAVTSGDGLTSGQAPPTLATRIERTHGLLERTSRQVARLDRLVGDLLDASRIQAGKLELRPESSDLGRIVADAVQEQRAAWPTRRIHLDVPHRRSLAVVADADRVGQVVTNYLTNALKYSADDQPVDVRVLADDAEARVEVRDHGPGLSTEQREHLFERFYRVPGIEQQSGSGVGLGLGLYICNTIVERHGGRVGVESAVGEGSTFWFALPLAPCGLAGPTA